VPDTHTLEVALQCGATLQRELYEEKPEYAGYAWYDRVPRIVDSAVLVDGILYDDWPEGSERPAKIQVEVTISESGQPLRSVRLPTLIHARTSERNEIEFVAVRNSPWDNDDLAGPFSVADFLIGATFCAGDDAECDSWDTQMDYYGREVERAVNSYFRGPRATLLALLQKAIDWDANQLADELKVKEILFKKDAAGRSGWHIELV